LYKFQYYFYYYYYKYLQASIGTAVTEVVNNFHPDRDGTGRQLIQYFERIHPSWFEANNETQNTQLLVLKQLISNLRLIQKKESIISYLSLAVGLFPDLTQQYLMEQLGAKESEMKTAVRY
jgi:hypothetical protein